MIGYIRGKVLKKFKSGKNTVSLVLWVGEEEALGLGYTVFVSELFSTTLSEGQNVEVWTYSVHNDSDSYLIGFSEADKMRIFLQLLEVSGVGPRSAMQIVDSVGVEKILAALATNDVKTFSNVSGIGQKTAAKIIVELSGKEFDVKSMLNNSNVDITPYADVTATLQKLGYSVSASRDAIAKASAELAMQPNLTTAEKVKLVLSKS